MISPFATVEEAFLLAKYAKQGVAERAIGGAQVAFESKARMTLYPKDIYGKPVPPTKFARFSCREMSKSTRCRSRFKGL